MRKPRSNPGKAGRNMSRGEFLAAGATVAVGGCAGGGGGGVSSLGAAQQVYCPKDNCLGTDNWYVDASILHILWSEILPRLVALCWRLGVQLVGSVPLDNARLRTAMQPLRWLNGGNPRFVLRFDALEAYLGGSAQIPIRVLAEGGFDFLLSNHGIDILVPAGPPSRLDLLRYYTFRRTGRRAIGAPYYLADTVTGMSTDSPTGPGQVIMDQSLLMGLLQGTSGCVSQVEECVRRLKEEGLVSVRHLQRSYWNSTLPEPETLLELVEKLDPEGVARLLSVGSRGLPQEVIEEEKTGFILSFQALECILEPMRCWQVEGSVFRAIIVELPRVVANIWMEEAMGTQTMPSTYSLRYNDAKTAIPTPPSVPSPTYSEFRKIFEERIETQLPKEDRMKFEVKAGIRDVQVTDRGFFFPEVSSLEASTGTGQEVAQLAHMLDQIVTGRAGNPVFTDSMRTGPGD